MFHVEPTPETVTKPFVPLPLPFGQQILVQGQFVFAALQFSRQPLEIAALQRIHGNQAGTFLGQFGPVGTLAVFERQGQGGGQQAGQLGQLHGSGGDTARGKGLCPDALKGKRFSLGTRVGDVLDGFGIENGAVCRQDFGSRGLVRQREAQNLGPTGCYRQTKIARQWHIQRFNRHCQSSITIGINQKNWPTAAHFCYSAIYRCLCG